MQTPEVLVTGGTGALGSQVVAQLRVSGPKVRVMSRTGSPGTFPGDLTTGKGLDEAVAGTDTIIHCATNPSKPRETDVVGTEHLIRAAEKAGVAHLIFISIVGVDRNPNLSYYRAKLKAERVIERSRVPWTILRATQFHEYALGMIRPLARFPAIMPVPRGFLLQPIEVGEVAHRLVELAFRPLTGRAPDIGGPEVLTFAELARAYLSALGKKRAVVQIPVPGALAAAFRAGAQITPAGKYGKVSWNNFLNHNVHRELTTLERQRRVT